MATAQMHQRQSETSNEAAAFDQLLQKKSRASLTRAAATILGVPPEKLCDLLRNVWTTSKGQPPLSDAEMFAGISMIARFELDPISREIYVTRNKDGRLMTIVGIDGWVKILDRTDHFDGFTQILHETANGEIDWAETSIYSTKRKYPTTYRAYAMEYDRVGGFVSKSMPSHMLRLFSLRHAARLFTPLGGMVVTEEEAAYLMRSESEQKRTGATLDALADRLLPKATPVATETPDPSETTTHPVETNGDISETSPPVVETESAAPSGPNKADVFFEYAEKITACSNLSEVNAVRDKYFHPDAPYGWNHMEQQSGEDVAENRRQAIRATRGPRK